MSTPQQQYILLKVSKERMLENALVILSEGLWIEESSPFLLDIVLNFQLYFSGDTSVPTLLFIHEKLLVDTLNTFPKPQFSELEAKQASLAWGAGCCPVHPACEAALSPSHTPQPVAAEPLWSGPQ